MKLKSIHLTVLRNEEHFQFVSDTLDLLNSANAEVKSAVGDALQLFADLRQREDRALEQIRKSALTTPIADTDTRRDSLYRGLALRIEACLHSPDENERNMATRVQLILDHYGNFTDKPYNEETATLYNLLQDLYDRCGNELVQLNAKIFTEALRDANEEFKTLMAQRFDAGAVQQYEKMKTLRKEADAVYRKIMAAVNASIVLHGANGYADFVNKLNERTAYYNNTLAARKGRREATVTPTETTVIPNAERNPLQ